ncbi:MAG: hypothetical protein IJ689_00765 [Alphaproteobacteria bacterium]|nr:hypothetical protein [Alphaproteobacteria bacterium]
MKNYILLLGTAAVALGSYAAYAGNSATMTVTATIAHDVSLTVTKDLSMGVLTIDPSHTEFNAASIDTSGAVDVMDGEGIISLTGVSAGTFTANLPSSCNISGIIGRNMGNHPCFRSEDFIFLGDVAFGYPYVTYVSGNQFRFQYTEVEYESGVVPRTGIFEEETVIEYIL